MENFLRSKEALGGTIRIGMIESLFELLFEPTISNYHKSFPHVKIDLAVDATETLKQQLQQGILDCACLISDPLPQTKWYCWHMENAPIVIVANPDNDLSKRESIMLQELQKEDFILMEESAPYSLQFQSIMARHNIPLHTFLTLQSTNMAKRLVEKGKFLSVLPKYTVEKSVEMGTIKILPVQNYEQIQYMQMVLHNNKVMTPQIENFLKEMRKVLQTIVPTTPQ
jgi:DNA-binding transcriptional LysR family regulator